MSRSQKHSACRRSGGAGRRSGAAQDADITYAAVAHGGRGAAVMDHRRLLPLHGHPLPVPDVRGPRRGGREGTRAGDQRPALDRGALPHGLPAVSGVGGADLRVRRGPDSPPNRRGVVRSGSGGSATILRVGSTALQKSGYPLATHEKALAAAASGALLGVSLLSLRFPRFLAWPLATTGALYGGLGVLRAARSALTDRKP